MIINRDDLFRIKNVLESMLIKKYKSNLTEEKSYSLKASYIIRDSEIRALDDVVYILENIDQLEIDTENKKGMKLTISRIPNTIDEQYFNIEDEKE